MIKLKSLITERKLTVDDAINVLKGENLDPTVLDVDAFKKEYHNFAKQYHPDVSQRDAEKMKDINQAIQILKDVNFKFGSPLGNNSSYEKKRLNRDDVFRIDKIEVSLEANAVEGVKFQNEFGKYIKNASLHSPIFKSFIKQYPHGIIFDISDIGHRWNFITRFMHDLNVSIQTAKQRENQPEYQNALECLNGFVPLARALYKRSIMNPQNSNAYPIFVTAYFLEYAKSKTVFIDNNNQKLSKKVNSYNEAMKVADEFLDYLSNIKLDGNLLYIHFEKEMGIMEESYNYERKQSGQAI